MKIQRGKISIALVLFLLVGITTACPFGKSDSKTRTLAKASDDVAQGLKSIATLLETSKQQGLVSQEDINEIKPFLLEVAKGNAEAISLGRRMLAAGDTIDKTDQQQLIDTINSVSSALLRANQVGLTRIKNEDTKLAFSTLITTIQAAATSAVIVLNLKGAK